MSQAIERNLLQLLQDQEGIPRKHIVLLAINFEVEEDEEAGIALPRKRARH